MARHSNSRIWERSILPKLASLYFDVWFRVGVLAFVVLDGAGVICSFSVSLHPNALLILFRMFYIYLFSAGVKSFKC